MLYSLPVPQAAKPQTGPLTQEIASILRSALARRKMTGAELSRAVGISAPQMSKVLAGTKQIDVELLDKMCWATGLSLRAVMKEADEETDARYFDEDWTVPMLRVKD